MQYKVLVVSGVQGWGTNFAKAGEELAKLVNGEIAEGWKPIGGVTVGTTQSTQEPYLLQAMTKL